jgi:hypothetical protein
MLFITSVSPVTETEGCIISGFHCSVNEICTYNINFIIFTWAFVDIKIHINPYPANVEYRVSS